MTKGRESDKMIFRLPKIFLYRLKINKPWYGLNRGLERDPNTTTATRRQKLKLKPIQRELKRTDTFSLIEALNVLLKLLRDREKAADGLLMMLQPSAVVLLWSYLWTAGFSDSVEAALSM